MKNPTLHSLPLTLGAAFLLAVSSASAQVAITNGDFETGIADDTTDEVIDSWFTATPTDFFRATWHDARDGEVATDTESGFSGEAAALFSGFAGNPADSGNNNYMYQSIGTDAAATSFSISFDWGDFGNYGGSDRFLGLNVGIYEFNGTGTFVAGNDTDLAGGDGVSLVDTVSFELTDDSSGTPKLVIGQVANLDLSTQSGGELFLRFENYGIGDSAWLTVDNISVVPEPGSFALLAGLFALGFMAVRRRK